MKLKIAFESTESRDTRRTPRRPREESEYVDGSERTYDRKREAKSFGSNGKVKRFYGGREGFEKKAAFESSESRDTRRAPRRPREESEYGDGSERMFDRKREAKSFGSDKKVRRFYGSREGFEKKASSGNRKPQAYDGGVIGVEQQQSVSHRTMWRLESDKKKSRRGKGKSELDLGSKREMEETSASWGQKKAQEKKKGLVYEDSEGKKVKMRMKRVIRIDRNDLTNKRIDDGIIIDYGPSNKNNGKYDKKDEKIDDVKEKPQMSLNAQFRAIQPSASILSYVEDNLLGRRRMIEIQRAGYNCKLSAPLDNIPNSTSEDREPIEENVFRSKLKFFAAAKISTSIPPPGAPEIAFAGRSNVGKSSLLNSLVRQYGVARTSDKPGLTQSINFFDLGSKICMVDLPGYGFAYAKEEVKDSWEELVKEYVTTRKGLRRVCLLIDTKWGMKMRDFELIELMERAKTQYQIIMTKTDTVSPIDVARRAMLIEETLKEHKSVVQPTMMISSKSGAGIRSLRTALTTICRYAKL